MSSRESEIETLEDAEDAGRWVKCELERLLELQPDTIAEVEISIETVGHRQRGSRK